MLRSSKELMGYELAAKDGSIGKVKDFLFDEAHWTIRWMVADTGRWLPGRKVLVSPVSLGVPDWGSRLLPVRLTKAEIENAPALDADAPVSRTYEKKWFDRYGWSCYWGGVGVWGGAVYPAELSTRGEKRAEVPETPEDEGNALRSVREVADYAAKARDGDIGHVEEFVMEDNSWIIRYMVVDTRNWMPGRKVLVSPEWIDSVKWPERRVALGLSRESVKHSPEYDPRQPVNREYEKRLYDYYGRPVYWTE